MFVGRKEELKLLNEVYHSAKSELVIIYGRRRIGKSSLVNHFAKNKSSFYTFEALEGETTQVQLRHFTELLKKQMNDPILESVHFKTWEAAFSYFTERFINQEEKRGEKKIIFFDEIQWMAAGRNRLISILKYYWDNQWKNKKIMLILCGSVASFMLKKIIKSKALYGRITLEILLKGLRANEAYAMFDNTRSKEEILKYLLVFGGVPKYLEEINLNRSFNHNMNKLCFSSHGLMLHEVNRIFYSQFKEARTYLRIVLLLQERIYSFNNISQKLSIASGGGLRQYLEQLEQAEIIKSFIPFDKSRKSKIKKYTLFDEYLIFYFKYIEPNLRIIEESSSERVFETLTTNSFDSWLGLAFERFCLKHSGILARLMGFEEDVLLASPYFGRNDDQFQIDLLYKRADNVITVCEIKHKKNKITTRIVPDMEKKCSLLKIPRGYTMEKALISLHGPDTALRDTRYFDYYVTLDDIFSS
ncbi:MAG: AAA family ATPase [bacterium]